MTNYEIAQKVASCHNVLAGIFASGGIILQNSDSVILMGDLIREMRTLVQHLQEGDDQKAGEQNNS